MGGRVLGRSFRRHKHAQSALVLLIALCFQVDAARAESAKNPDQPSAGAPTPGPAVILPDLPYDKPARTDLDEYGGWTGLKGKKTGFFHVEKIGSRWWFVTPAGNVFFALGVTMHSPKLGMSEEEFSKLQVHRLRAWGFNHTQSGQAHPKTADAGMPATFILNFARLAKGQIPIAASTMLPPWGTLPDVFDPEWPARCEKCAQDRLAPAAKDPLLLGYFLDNELRLDGWYQAATLNPSDAPARRAFVDVARKYYAEKPDQLAADWKKYNVTKIDDLLTVQGPPPEIPGLVVAWNVAVAERYFSVTSAACKKAAPNHLNLGFRMMMTSLPSPEVFKVMAKYCDVISMNFYPPFSDRLVTETFTILPALHAVLNRPFLTSEFSYRGGDTMHPNTMGAPPTVPTQTDRAVGYLSYMSAVASLPFFVGTTWFCLGDQDVEVPWQHYAEDCDFGILDRQGRPYAVLTETMRRVNASIYDLAADPIKNKTCPLFWRTELMRWDRNADKAMFRIFGLRDLPPDPLAALLPSPRRYHAAYWVRHQSPNLTVNGEGFYGSHQANMIRKTNDGTDLVLLGQRGLFSLPRALWLGQTCDRPDEALVLESNAQLLARNIDSTGKLKRLTIVDGSFIRLQHGDVVVRTNAKTPYLDLQYDHPTKRLAVTTRGYVTRLGVTGVDDWQVLWNGKPAKPGAFPVPKGMRALTPN
ncbi:MAG: hypothetical protein JXQ73_29905 [Phycisphaerae bacterium]|nr:hypothetical protein [Phycisphaerae bacterium]